MRTTTFINRKILHTAHRVRLFLGAFAKFRKATICHVTSLSVCLSMRLSVCMEQLGSHWPEFHETYIRGFFEIC